MQGLHHDFRNLHHYIFSTWLWIFGLYFTVCLTVDIFNIIMHCLFLGVFPERYRNFDLSPAAIGGTARSIKRHCKTYFV